MIIERVHHTYTTIGTIDRNVGLMLDEPEQQGLMGGTVAILASDHGELLGNHGL